MTQDSLGVAVVGVGMVGRAHAAGYRTAAGLFDINDRPDTRLVAIADAYEPFAVDAAKRFGYERSETSWQAIVDAPDIDVVSVAVANSMHREVVEAMLAAGKHVLCEKPLAPSVEDAKAMVAAAEAATTHAGIGFTFRRAPGINAIRQQVQEGAIGEVRHFNGHYWCDYGQNPNGPISWRYRGGPGSGALADIGSHMIDLGEYICGPMTSVSGAVFQTFTTERPVPTGVTVGHGGGEVGEEKEAVDNEDIATFTATFANGSVGTFSISRVAHGLPNGLGFEVFAEKGHGGLRPEPAGRVHLRRPRTGRHRERAAAGAARARSTPTSSAACRWTSRRSATGRTTSSPGRPVPSSTRWPGSTGCPPYRRCSTDSTTWRSSPPSPSPHSTAARPSPSPDHAHPPRHRPKDHAHEARRLHRRACMTCPSRRRWRSCATSA